MVQTERDNRYFALFNTAFANHFGKPPYLDSTGFVALLLDRIRTKLEAEGERPAEIEAELLLAKRAAEAAEILHTGQAASRSQSLGTVPVPEDMRTRGWRSVRTIFLFLASFLAVIAYSATNLMFAFEHQHAPVAARSDLPSTTLTVDVAVADFNTQKILVHLKPIGGQFIGADGKPTEDIELRIDGGDGFSSHVFKAHAPQPPFSMPVEIDSGDILNYPFDRYTAELDIEARVGGKPVAVRTVLDNVPHNLDVTLTEDASNSDDVGDFLVMSRSNVELFVIFLSVGSLVVVTISSLWVAWYVVMSGRSVGFDMLIWTAALLFVIPTAREALPGDPPYGSAVDFMVFFWLQAACALATIVLVRTWIRRSEQLAT